MCASSPPAVSSGENLSSLSCHQTCSVRLNSIDCFVEVRHEETCDSWGTSKKESRTESESLWPTYSGGRYKSSSTKCLVKKYLPTGLELKVEVWFELEGSSLAIHRLLLSMQARFWTHDFWRPVFTGIRGGWDEIRLQMNNSDTCSKGNAESGFLSWRSGHCDEVCQYRKNWFTDWHSLGRISSHQSWTYAQSGSKCTAVNMEKESSS